MRPAPGGLGRSRGTCRPGGRTPDPTLSLSSAGVGRTGVFITLSIVLERMRYEGVVDMFQTVKTLRTQRPAMVQTEVRAGAWARAASADHCLLCLGPWGWRSGLCSSFGSSVLSTSGVSGSSWGWTESLWGAQGDSRWMWAVRKGEKSLQRVFQALSTLPGAGAGHVPAPAPGQQWLSSWPTSCSECPWQCVGVPAGTALTDPAPCPGRTSTSCATAQPWSTSAALTTMQRNYRPPLLRCPDLGAPEGTQLL